MFIVLLCLTLQDPSKNEIEKLKVIVQTEKDPNKKSTMIRKIIQHAKQGVYNNNGALKISQQKLNMIQNQYNQHLSKLEGITNDLEEIENQMYILNE